MRPFAAIEGEGMIDLAHSLWNFGAKYGCISRDELINAIPCATTVSRQVRNHALNKKKELKSILSDIFNRNPLIAVTCDAWQDNYRGISYLGVTIHFYDEGKLCDQLIAVKPLDWRQKKDHEFIKQTAKLIL